MRRHLRRARPAQARIRGSAGAGALRSKLQQLGSLPAPAPAFSQAPDHRSSRQARLPLCFDRPARRAWVVFANGFAPAGSPRTETLDKPGLLYSAHEAACSPRDSKQSRGSNGEAPSPAGFSRFRKPPSAAGDGREYERGRERGDKFGVEFFFWRLDFEIAPAVQQRADACRVPQKR